MMKKWGLALICALLLMGCHPHQSVVENEITSSTKQDVYQYLDLLLFIDKETFHQNGFSFQIELNGVGIGDFAVIYRSVTSSGNMYPFITKRLSTDIYI